MPGIRFGLPLSDDGAKLLEKILLDCNGHSLRDVYCVLLTTAMMVAVRLGYLPGDVNSVVSKGWAKAKEGVQWEDRMNAKGGPQ